MRQFKNIRSKLRELSKEELIDIIEALLPLIDRVERLEKEIEKLKNRNSKNSSLPPSTDRQKNKKTRSLRKKSGRKGGGQKGHSGDTLRLSEVVDDIVENKVSKCTHCSKDLSACESEILERKQVLDIPPSRMVVTEHRRWRTFCRECNKWTHAKFTSELRKGPAVRYGERVRNYICYLNIRQMLPYQRLSECIEVMFGQRISEGTIDNIIKAKTTQAENTYCKIITAVENSQVIGGDESGCTVNGKKAWAWAWVTPHYSLFRISDNRGRKTIDEFFPHGFSNGVLTSDCWKPHLNTKAKAHQICIPHLRRECRGFMDFSRSKWARQMDLVLLDILTECRKQRIPVEIKKRIENDLDKLLSRELTRSNKEIRTFRNRLIRLRQNITICLYNRKVPPDNNATERAIRMIKLKKKISGQFRSWRGAHCFSVLRTIVDSAIKQGLHPFEALKYPEILLNSY